MTKAEKCPPNPANPAGKKGRPSSHQKHLQSRIAYLYQAALYLETAASSREIAEPGNDKDTDVEQVSSDVGLAAAAAAAQIGSQRDNHYNEAVAAVTEPSLSSSSSSSSSSSPPFSTQTRHLLSSMRSVSQKAQIRLSRPIKLSVCRRCNGLLFRLPSLSSLPSSLSPSGLSNVNGTGTGTAEIENLSRGGRKPWADVLVVKCRSCGFVKRYPIGAGAGEGSKKREKKITGEDDHDDASAIAAMAIARGKGS
jgi:ribonuclease P protein subunit RPR2